MEYHKKLKNPRWQRKRLEIMDRDDFKCVGCGKSSESLHVHHIFYEGANPWHTRDKYLQTLCSSCHKILGVHKRGAVGYIHMQKIICLMCPVCYADSCEMVAVWDDCCAIGFRCNYCESDFLDFMLAMSIEILDSELERDGIF